MQSKRRNGPRYANAFAIALYGLSVAGSSGAQQLAVYDELPDGPPATIATLYYSALSLAGRVGLDRGGEGGNAGRGDAALQGPVDRSGASGIRRNTHARTFERLAGSALVWSYPDALRQACAQYAVADGVCETHAGYVRRVGVIEEMLVQGQLSLDELELELIGERRPRFGGQGR